MNEPLSYTFQDIDIKNKKVFSHIFAELRGNDQYDDYIDYKGLKVYPVFRIHLISECKVKIAWIAARQNIPQGVDLCVCNAKLKLLDGSNDETKKGFAFMYSAWANSVTPLLCTPIKFRNQEKQQKKKWISLHNIWETKRSDGRMERSEWGGNYGVVIEQREKNIYRLHFSCGKTEHPDVTFEDLVVDVSIEGEYTIRFQCSEI